MQILQWLFKVNPEQGGGTSSNSSHADKQNIIAPGNDACEGKEVALCNKQGRVCRSKGVKESDYCHNHNQNQYQRHHLWGKFFKPFAILCRKDVAEACFYSTLSLRRLRSIDRIRRRRKWENLNKNIIMMMKKKDDEENLSSHDSAATGQAHAAAGNKVLPITEQNEGQCGGTTTEPKQDKNTNNNNNNNNNNKLVKGESTNSSSSSNKNKTMSRMKELLRWAAAAKSDKGGKFLGRKVLYFRNRVMSQKIVTEEDQQSIDSPKISFRWDVESSTSSVYSGISMASSSLMNRTSGCNNVNTVSSTPTHRTPRTGNWITTDSDFVVLEL